MSGIAAAARPCRKCNRRYPLRGTICTPCARESLPGYNQDQDQDQDQDQGTNQDFLSFNGKQFPGPGCNGDAPTRARVLVVKPEADDQPEMHRLEDAHDAGELEPHDVHLGKMPPSAGPVMRAIAAHMRLRMGLRRAVGDDRPLPYATSEAVRNNLAKDKATASNAIGGLVRAGVIQYVGRLKPLRPGLDGAKLYAPPGEVHEFDGAPE